MSKVIYLEKDQFGEDGTVPVFKGDDWAIRTRIGNDAPGLPFAQIDMTGKSVTGYFPAATGGTVTAIGTVTDAPGGRVTFDLPPESTEQTLETTGTDFYAIVEDGDEEQETYQTRGQLLEIKSRGFTSV